MSDMQKKFPFIIAIACGILAIVLLNVYLKQREEQLWQNLKKAAEQQKKVEEAQQPKMAVVLVAKQQILAQTPITADDLSIKQVPENYIQPGAATSLETVIGQISQGPILEGEQILQTKLTPPGKIGKALSEITPKGKRAMTIPVDNISVISGFLQPGDFVDVVALLSVEKIKLVNKGDKKEKNEDDIVTVPFLQGIEVLAVGTEYIPYFEAAQEPDKKKKQERTSPSTVTLSLTLQEALLLSHVQELGKIKLVMHSAGDEEKESASLVSEEILIKYLQPEVKIPVYEPETVEVYRGQNREVMPLSQREDPR